MPATLRYALGAAALAASVAGCGEGGPPRSPVSGRVTFNGEPIDEGRISLLPIADTGDGTVTAPITGGEYALRGDNAPAVGEYRVEIEGFRKTGRTVRNLASPDRNKAAPPTVDEVTPFVPPQFNLQSTLSIRVTAEPTQKDFDLVARNR
ncbi:hypothetical protein [Botrimarina sp.]|uniref:hypothetical protein n=1 Tax=Botrimarina sp. TaxID=2795802 RepID=UPI0032EF96E2